MNLRISVFCFDLLPLDLRLEGSPEQGERTMPLDPPEPGFDVEQRRSEDPGASDPGGRPSPPGRSTGTSPGCPPGAGVPGAGQAGDLVLQEIPDRPKAEGDEGLDHGHPGVEIVHSRVVASLRSPMCLDRASLTWQVLGFRFSLCGELTEENEDGLVVCFTINDTVHLCHRVSSPMHSKFRDERREKCRESCS